VDAPLLAPVDQSLCLPTPLPGDEFLLVHLFYPGLHFLTTKYLEINKITSKSIPKTEITIMVPV
jgi:hypothetical protein